jgi:amino acid permease
MPIAGAGVLAFPSAFRETGIVGGIVLTLLFAAVMGWTLHILGMASNGSRQDSYQGVIRALLGPFAGFLVSVSMSIYLFGSCIAYLDIIADQVSSVAIASGMGDTALASRPVVMAVVVLTVLVPLCLLPKIEALNYASAVAVLSIVYLEGDVVAHSVAHLTSATSAHVEVSLLNVTVGLFKALPILSFALQCHLVYVPVYHSLKVQSLRVMDLVSVVCYALCLMLYLPTGIMGYLQFGEQTCSDIVSQNLPSVPDTDVARGSIALTALLSYPLLHFVARTTLNDVLFGGASFKRDDGRHVAVAHHDDGEAMGDDGHAFSGATDLALASPAPSIGIDGEPLSVGRNDGKTRLLLNGDRASTSEEGEGDGAELEAGGGDGCAAQCNRRSRPRTCGMNSMTRYLVLTFGFIGATYAVALAVSNLGLVLGVTGSTAAVVQVFLFPAALLLRLSALHFGGGVKTWYDGASTAAWAGCTFLVVFGVAMGTVSLVALALSTNPANCK